MLTPDKLKEISKEITKTGFPFEFEVAAAFEKDGWLIISNKYYLDDIESKPREIDLIVYKSSKVKHLNVYTAIVISCKKSDENAWAILSRKPNLANPNTDWWPLHLWSNDKAINFEVKQPGKRRKYYADASIKGVKHVINEPNSEIFAFQEMKVATGKPDNDRAIFLSISSLLQAQAYELGVLPDRKKVPSVYQFNLLSTLDGELVNLHFDNKEIKPKNIDSAHYLSRYIIKKQEVFSRILFLKKEKLKEIIKDYSRLHEANCKIFKKMHEDFFSAVIEDDQRRNLYLADFKKEIFPKIYWEANREYKTFEIALKESDFGLYWNSRSKKLEVTIEYDSERVVDYLDRMNNNAQVKKIISEALMKIYNFSGPFVFQEIPF